MSVFSLTLLVNAENDEGSKICAYLSNDLGVKEGIMIPSSIPYSNEAFNLYTKDNEVIGQIIIKEKEITLFNCEISDKPTYNVYIKDLSTLKNIIDSEKQVDELSKAISDKDIEVKGNGFGKKLKGVFTRMGVKIASWFS